MINAISAADIAFIMSSSMSAWLLGPLECSPRVSRKLRPRNFRPQTSDLENSDLETSDLQNSDLETSDPFKNKKICRS